MISTPKGRSLISHYHGIRMTTFQCPILEVLEEFRAQFTGNPTIYSVTEVFKRDTSKGIMYEFSSQYYNPE